MHKHRKREKETKERASGLPSSDTSHRPTSEEKEQTAETALTRSIIITAYQLFRIINGYQLILSSFIPSSTEIMGHHVYLSPVQFAGAPLLARDDVDLVIILPEDKKDFVGLWFGVVMDRCSNNRHQLIDTNS